MRSEGVAAIRAELEQFEEDCRMRRAEIVARLCGTLSEGSPEIDPLRVDDLIRPWRAAKLSGWSRATVHRLCKKNEIDDKGIGFALQDKGGRYQISRSRFAAFCEQYPAPRYKSETKIVR